MKLPLPDHFRWLTLRRIRHGTMTKLDDRYLDNGRPLGILIADTVHELLKQELLTVADPDPTDGLSRVSLTEAGQSHYRTLCQRQQARLPPPPPEFTPTPTPAPTPPPTMPPSAPQRPSRRS